MRIITGQYKGRHFDIPRSFKARPTTDFAKENIFNVLQGYIDFEDATALDLFAGTGSISLELVSRGCQRVISVEADRDHANFIRECFKKLDLFCFDKNRFKFFNSFNAAHAKDALYFILYVWKQMGLDQMQDELHVSGEVPDKDWFLYNSKLYIRKTFLLNPAAEFNRAPITEIKGMPFDLLALYLSK